MKGKNFSGNNTGKRKKSDFYETPYSITEQFLEIEPISPGWSILEASSGKGAILLILKKYYNNVSDYNFEKGEEFLEKNKQFDFIITNPPFSLTYEFIEKAKKVCNIKFAFLLPLAYLHGKKKI